MTKMSNKGKKINDAIDWLIVGAAIYFTTITIAGIAKWKRTHGVGKVERVKRRIYKEVSLAQDAGIDFTKKVDELNNHDRELLDVLGANAGWKQSKRSVESGKPYADAYYGSLRRAWNAVSGLGIRGIGRTYKVKDADGNTVLTWIEDAAAHVEAERRTLEAEKRAAESRRNLRKNRRERRNQTPVVVSPSAPEIVENYNQEPEIEAEKEEIVVETPQVRKPTRAELKEAEREERLNFAKQVLKRYIIKDKANWYREWGGKTIADWVTEAFADKNIKLLKSDEVKIFANGKWNKRHASWDDISRAAKEMVVRWEESKINKGFNREDLNDIKRALLDKAEHMQVVTSDDRLVPYEEGFTKADRYNYIDDINWIQLVSTRSPYAGETYYPFRSFPTKAAAMEESDYGTHGRERGEGWKLVPVWEVDIQRITGLPN